jgi:hypothetical protein
MTKAQTQLYFREWAAVRKAQPDADRHELHVKALGKDKSSKAFTNSDFDRVLQVFRAISQPGNLNAQLRQAQQVRYRLEHRLSETQQCLGVYVDDVAGYVAQVVADKFGSSVTGVDDLSHEPRLVWNEKSQEMEEKPSELLMLVMTLWDRLQALRRKRGDSLADMFQAAGIAKGQEDADEETAPTRTRRRTTSAEREAQPVAAGVDGEDPF